MPTQEIQTLIILGARGDLTERLLLPGLANALATGKVDAVQVIGSGRPEISDDDWHKVIDPAFAGSPSEAGDKTIADSQYIQADPTSREGLQKLLDAATGTPAFYFALPPSITQKVCGVLADMDLPEGTALAIEKPFGTNLAGAQEFNHTLLRTLDEEHIHRVDHFLAKATVLNLVGLRFANRLFENVLNRDNVKRVEIIYDETLALEGRAGYYDTSGALVDMVQSHLLLVLALVAMEQPSSLGADDLHGAMMQALRGTAPWKEDGTSSRRARYTAGTVDGKEIPSYVDEDGVDPKNETDTLTEVTLAVDTWRWADVPFVLRSGKAIAEKRQEIVITFRDVPHLPKGFQGDPRPAQLRIGMKPATLDLSLRINDKGDWFDLAGTNLHADLAPADLDSYGEVIDGLLHGDRTLAVRGDMAEECWRIVEPVLNAWAADTVPLEDYPAGSTGPDGWGVPKTS